MIHLGALVGSAVGPLKSKTLGFYSKLGWRYGNDKDKRDFISSGAAAGTRRGEEGREGRREERERDRG